MADGDRVALGNAQLIPGAGAARLPGAAELERQGKTLFYLSRNEALAGAIAVADTLRPEVPQALRELRALGIERIELLTGDNERAASAVAEGLAAAAFMAAAMSLAGGGAANGRRVEIPYRAGLLPEDKIAIVKEYQAQGRTVVMVGDGVNDAPALAQADVGIAMGAAGTDIALEAAHIALMREDWRLVPEALRIARRTMGVVKLNLGFTAAYNVAGLALAALGLLPPVFAAAAQSLPDRGLKILTPGRKAAKTPGKSMPPHSSPNAHKGLV